jgi:hypothetical protein
MAPRDHGRDVESGQTRRLEPQAGQRSYPRVLDDRKRRGRQDGEIRFDLGYICGLVLGAE